MNEENFKNGAIQQTEEELGAMIAFEYTQEELDSLDFKKGFDVRNPLNDGIKEKYQGPSLSCVGQGWSYQAWIFQVIEMMRKYGMNLKELREKHPEKVEELSAKFIYSQIVLRGGSAYLADGGQLIVDVGAVKESVVPSHKPDGSVDEAFMEDRSWKTDAILAIAKALRGKQLQKLPVKNDMRLFALAIQKNFGVVGGVNGSNGRGWSTENPHPPQPGDAIWGHCIFFGAFGTDELGEFIATPNSNGPLNPNYKWKPGDPPGEGWQKLRSDYFNTPHLFNPLTYTDLPNPNEDTMLRLVKGTRPEIYIVGTNGKLCHIAGPGTWEAGKELGWWGDFELKDQAWIDAQPKGMDIGFIF